MSGSYWNNTGKYQAEYEIIKTGIPLIGETNYLELELIRAVSKIYYNYFNDGFGGNWTGAWNFINDNFAAELDLLNEMNILSDYSSEIYVGENSFIEGVVESLVNKSIKYLIDIRCIRDGKLDYDILTKYDEDFNESSYYVNHEYDDEIDNEYFYDDSDED